MTSTDCPDLSRDPSVQNASSCCSGLRAPGKSRQAVIHGGENRRTIMSVACLNGLDETDWPVHTNVYVPKIALDVENVVVGKYG